MKTITISRQGRRKRGDLYECTECHRFLPARAFRKLPKVRCGLSPSCIDCDKTRGAKYRCSHRSQTKARYKRWYAKNRQRVLTHAQEYLQELRLQVITAYGGQCECCGEPAIEFLVVDHRLNDGNAERANGLRAGRPLYLHLIRKGFPKDRYRILCHNCNMSRGLYGYCPHERKEP